MKEVFEAAVRPVVTVMFAGTACWIALRSGLALNADQFNGLVMAVILFWFGMRQGQKATNGDGPK